MPSNYQKNQLSVAIMAILFVTLCVGCGGDQPGAESASQGDWGRVSEILERIQAPSFPERDFSVLDYGAIADGHTDCRQAIWDAIKACNRAGGGRVVLPEGIYLVNGPIHLKSNVNLHLGENATIKFGVNPEDYLPVVLVRWEGTRCYNYSPLIYAYQQENIAITGEGTIDGQTEKFWYLWKLIHDTDKSVLRRMGKNLEPLEKRVFGAGHFLRPTLIEPYECKNVLIEGVIVKSSPFWTVHPVLCTNVTIRNLKVEPGKSNDDGCNPESCQYVLIEDCSFRTQDDNIAIKAGRDNDAWIENGGRPSENIVIRSCRFHGETGAITIGSEMSGGIRNIFAENCDMDTVGVPFFIKSNTDRGGVVENIHYRNIRIRECTDELARIRLDYKGATGGEHPAIFRNFFFENINCERAETGFRILGLPEKTINNIYLRDVTIKQAMKESEVYYASNIGMQNVQLNAVHAIREEYYARGASEEQPGRLYWDDLPRPVQRTFLKVINSVVDSRTEVPAPAREDVKRAFAEDPTITVIDRFKEKNRMVYRLTKIFGSEDIAAKIDQDGTLLEKS